MPATHSVRMRLPLLALALLALLAALWAGLLNVLVLLVFIANTLRVIRRSKATQLRTTTPTLVPTPR